MSDASPLVLFLTGLQPIGSQTPGMQRHREQPYHRHGQVLAPAIIAATEKATEVGLCGTLRNL